MNENRKIAVSKNSLKGNSKIAKSKKLYQNINKQLKAGLLRETQTGNGAGTGVYKPRIYLFKAKVVAATISPQFKMF